MRNIYGQYFLLNTIVFLTIIVSSCTEDHDDIAAPLITFIQPVENDTVTLVNGLLFVKVRADDKINIHDMEMEIKNQSGTVLGEYDKDDINVLSYTCFEEFNLSGLTEKTKVTLLVTFENEHKNWCRESVDFFVKP